MPLTTLHCPLRLQGDGIQGSVGVSLGLSWHIPKGSPMRGCGQLHIGLWFITLHTALNPHTPGQGLIHLFLIQALSLEQSVLIVHSGRQPPAVGLPKKPGKHSQRAVWPAVLQIVFIPHGDGLHGSCGNGSSVKSKYLFSLKVIWKILQKKY